MIANIFWDQELIVWRHMFVKLCNKFAPPAHRPTLKQHKKGILVAGGGWRILGYFVEDITDIYCWIFGYLQYILLVYFYRTQVYLGSDLWVLFSLTE